MGFIYVFAAIGLVSTCVVVGFLLYTLLSNTLKSKYWELKRENEDLQEKLDDYADELYMMKWIRDRLKEEGVDAFSEIRRKKELSKQEQD